MDATAWFSLKLHSDGVDIGVTNVGHPNMLRVMFYGKAGTFMATSTIMQSLVTQLRKSIKVHGSVRTTSGWSDDLTRPYLNEARVHAAPLITYLPSQGNGKPRAQTSTATFPAKAGPHCIFESKKEGASPSIP